MSALFLDMSSRNDNNADVAPEEVSFTLNQYVNWIAMCRVRIFA